jgi:hypothetical protein
MTDLRPPVTGAHDRLPRPRAHRTAASAGLHGHAGPLSVTRVPTRPAAAAAPALPDMNQCLTFRYSEFAWKIFLPTRNDIFNV